MIERYSGKAAATAAFLFISLLAVSTAVASISVSPVRLDLSNTHDKDFIRVSNQEDRPKSYQVEVVSWSQSDGRPEVYAPTESMLVVPPLFTLQPGEDQLVRVGMLGRSDSETEQSYRVFITEIAPPKDDAEATSGITMRLQIGVPVFVAPEADAVATLDLVNTNTIDGKLFLEFSNSGNTHVKVSKVTYKSPGLEDPVVSPASMYVLAGQTGSLPVPSPDGRPVGKVTLVTDTLGTVEYALPGSP